MSKLKAQKKEAGLQSQNQERSLASEISFLSLAEN